MRSMKLCCHVLITAACAITCMMSGVVAEPTSAAVVKCAGFTEEWPDRVRGDRDTGVEVISEDADKEAFIYESEHYRYLSDVRLSMSVVKGFSVLFETTHDYVRKLPLQLDGGALTDGKLLIRLFEERSSYEKAGGLPQSGGTFFPTKKCVMVPLTSLGVRKVGSGYMFYRDKCNSTLAHELAHQLTPFDYYKRGSIGWFIEGLADYVSGTPYRSGIYEVRGNWRDIVETVTAYGPGGTGGMALGNEIMFSSLRDILTRDYAKFREGGKLSYAESVMVFHYFAHVDGKGDAARMKAFLNALRDGKQGEDALAVLLDGRNEVELGNEIAAAWKKRRVKIDFAE